MLVFARDAEIPALGFGTWQLAGETCAARVQDALEIGYRHVDTAQAYENHEAVGAGLRRAGVPRDDVFLTTKLWLEHLRFDDVIATTEQSLRELGTDHLDLLLIHWPNPNVPLEETLDAMCELQRKERVRHVGVSNFPPSWVERADAHAPLVCDQVEYHPLLSQDPLLDTLRERGMALVAYSPLAHGAALDQPLLAEIGRRHGKTAAQVALRWLLSQEQVVAIPKASTREHAQQNFEIFDFELDDEEIGQIHALAEREGERQIDPDFAPRWER